MSYNEATDHTESDSDLWHVQLASGEVCLMTLELLDDAFQTGVIHENTYLWQEGATGWVTLRDVAGLDSDDDSSHQSNGFGNSGHAPQSSAPPGYGATDSAWPPVAPAPAYGYDAQGIYAPPIQNMGLHSTVPVVAPIRDMEFDLDPVSFKKKRSGGKMLFAAAVVGAVAFGAVKYGLVQVPQGGSDPAANAAAVSPVPPSDMAATRAQPASPPAIVDIPATPKPDPAKVLPDDVKQRLANADKALAERQRAKQQQLQQSRSAPRSSRSRPSGEKVFHKGGETGDPLNSAL